MTLFSEGKYNLWSENVVSHYSPSLEELLTRKSYFELKFHGYHIYSRYQNLTHNQILDCSDDENVFGY